MLAFRGMVEGSWGRQDTVDEVHMACITEGYCPGILLVKQHTVTLRSESGFSGSTAYANYCPLTSIIKSTSPVPPLVPSVQGNPHKIHPRLLCLLLKSLHSYSHNLRFAMKSIDSEGQLSNQTMDMSMEITLQVGCARASTLRTSIVRYHKGSGRFVR